jgi:hypothetical protein
VSAKTSIHVQWKGTSACLDINCKCGAHSHFDGFGAYHVKCRSCDRIYRLETELHFTEVDASTVEDSAIVVGRSPWSDE